MIDASYDELNQYKDREKQLTKVRKNIEAILSENALEKDKEGDTNKAPKKPGVEGKGNKIPVIE